MSIRELHAASPVGAIGAGVAGLLVGSFYALGVVFARRIGLSISEASLFMSMVVLGGFSFQWPIGILADRHDRRLVLCGVLLAAGISWPLLASLTASGLPLLGLLVLALSFGGGSAASIRMRRTDLRSPRAQTLRRGGRTAPAVLRIRSDGWPLLTSMIMAALGPYSFFAFETIVAVTFAGFVAYRVRRRPPLPADEQEAFGAERDADRYRPRSSHRR